MLAKSAKPFLMISFLLVLALHPGIAAEEGNAKDRELLMKLEAERIDALREVEKDCRQRIQEKKSSPRSLDPVVLALIHAQLTTTQKQAERVALREQFVKQLAEAEQYAKELVDAGRIRDEELAAAKATCRQAETLLLRERGVPKAGSKEAQRLRELLVQERDALRVVKADRLQGVNSQEMVEGVAVNSWHLARVEMELAGNPMDRAAAWKGHLKAMKDLEERMEAQFKAGRCAGQDYEAAKAVCREAELALLREQAGDKPAERDLMRIKELLAQRRNCYLAIVSYREKRYEAGADSIEDVLKASRRLRDAELELAAKAADRVALYEAHLKLAQKVEKVRKAQLDAGRCGKEDYQWVRAVRCGAEIALLRERLGVKPVPGIAWEEYLPPASSPIAGSAPFDLDK